LAPHGGMSAPSQPYGCISAHYSIGDSCVLRPARIPRLRIQRITTNATTNITMHTFLTVLRPLFPLLVQHHY
jgi:hypothetical protein